MATFYIEALEATIITLSQVGSPSFGTVNYGINNPNTPSAYSYGSELQLAQGDKVFLKTGSTSGTHDGENYIYFTSTGRINTGGSISDINGGLSSARDYLFYKLFCGCDKLISAADLVLLSSVSSRANVYAHMFENCTGLISAPAEIKHNSSCNYLCDSMFKGCTSLTTPPALPSTYAADYCYKSMFEDCTALTYAPELKATSLKPNCYERMFAGCTAMTSIASMAVTTYGVSSCYQMYYGCTSIPVYSDASLQHRTALRIPGNTVTTDSLTEMFSGTGGNVDTPTLGTVYYSASPEHVTLYVEALEQTNISFVVNGTLTTGTCYYGIDNNVAPNVYTYGQSVPLQRGQKCYWFMSSVQQKTISNYISLTSSGNIRIAGKITDLCGGGIPKSYECCRMFYCCDKLIDTSDLDLSGNGSSYCYSYLFYGCRNLTSTPKLENVILSKGMFNYAFYGCSSLEVPPKMPNSNLQVSCFSYMFANSGLTTPPELEKYTTLESSCFDGMLSGCKKLKLPPKLPVTKLAPSCYKSLFAGSGITEAPELPATTLENSCYYSMFAGCMNLKYPPDLPAKSIPSNAYSYMFQDSCNLLYAPNLPAVIYNNNAAQNMFMGCKSLVEPPLMHGTSLGTYCFSGMFIGCSSLARLPNLPATTIPDGAYKEMFQYCPNIRLNASKTSIYTNEFRVPMSGTGTVGTDSFLDMFTSTGGITSISENTTYYLPYYEVTEVKYKDKTIVVGDGEEMTLNCYGKYMEDDVVVSINLVGASAD